MRPCSMVWLRSMSFAWLAFTFGIGMSFHFYTSRNGDCDPYDVYKRRRICTVVHRVQDEQKTSQRIHDLVQRAIGGDFAERYTKVSGDQRECADPTQGIDQKLGHCRPQNMCEKKQGTGGGVAMQGLVRCDYLAFDRLTVRVLCKVFVPAHLTCDSEPE